MKKLIPILIMTICPFSFVIGQILEFHSNDPYGIRALHPSDTSRSTVRFDFVDVDNDDDLDLLLVSFALSDTATFPPRASDITYFIEVQENIGDKWNPQFDQRKPALDKLELPTGEGFFLGDFLDINNDNYVDGIINGEVDEFYAQHLLFYAGKSDESFDTIHGTSFDLYAFPEGSFFMPEIVDLDADGDYDLLMSGFQSNINPDKEDENMFLYAKNIGTPSDPEFLGWFPLPYGLEPDTFPTLLIGGDLDLDDDVDLIALGLNNGASLIYFYENEAGPDGRPSFVNKTMQPFGIPDPGPDDGYFVPAIADIDGDGDLDLFLPFATDSSYYLQFWENKTCDAQRLTIDAMICAGESYEVGGQSFTESGTYIIESFDSTKCIEIIELTLDVVRHDTTYIEDQVCSGDVITIAGQEFDTTGVYELSVMSSSGCDSTIIADLDFQSIDLTITQSGPTLNAVSNPDYSYQWLDCQLGQIVDSATTHVFEVVKSGEFAVIITTVIGCVDTSDCVSVITTNTQAQAADDLFQVVPNPAGTTFTIIGSPSSGPDRITMTDRSGATVLDLKSPGSNRVTVDQFPDGVYLLTIEYEGKIEIERVVILK